MKDWTQLKLIQAKFNKIQNVGESQKLNRRIE